MATLRKLPKRLGAFAQCRRYVCQRSGTATNWKPPQGKHTGIYLWNSLTKRLDELVVDNEKPISWYMCGPTVYDSMHVGHASSYVRFDIIRRILRDYFRVNVMQVMGMTDIDDKIIARARERNMPVRYLARHYEAKFMRDMRRLNIIPPDYVTRVTEHIDEVVAMVAGLVKSRHAYVGDSGSVYFDTHAYGARYGKLAPERVGGAENGEEDEEPGRDKRRARDFALWKAAHVDDPDDTCWASRWGKGRPGWHIECSAMSTAVFGPRLTLHTGGIDLLFPHHENEIAQCEASHGGCQWVDYFLHTGHLHIEDRKMSKSLKNFITVEDYLSCHTAETFRMFCLMTKYNRPVDYAPQIIAHAHQTEHRFRALMARVRDVTRPSGPGDALDIPRKWEAEHHRLQDLVHHIHAAIDKALRNDFDTPHVVAQLQHLGHELSSHINRMLVAPAGQGTAAVDQALVQSVARVIAGYLDMLGLDLAHESVPVATRDTLSPELLLDVITSFRHHVRETSLAALKSPHTGKAPYKDLLLACDDVRDTQLRPLGISLLDGAGGAAWQRDT